MDQQFQQQSFQEASQTPSDASSTIVDVKNLDVHFGSFAAVKNVSFSVKRGEIFGFLGANGAGKTTTIRVICGLIHATHGEVIVDGEKFVKGKEDIIKSKVGYMSQRFTLYDDLTIKENLDFTAAIRKVPNEEYQKRKQEFFQFIRLDRDENCRVSDLPGGIKQQVALVAALIHNPSLVVLDEPTAGVSPAARAYFWDLIRKLTQIGKTVFVTTHYMDEAENCHRVALMRSGELIALGSVPQLREQTFHKPMYVLSPALPLSQNDISLLHSFCDTFEPYGIHYHFVLKEEHLLNKMQEFGTVSPISPSLEDIFVQLVEGNR